MTISWTIFSYKDYWWIHWDEQRYVGGLHPNLASRVYLILLQFVAFGCSLVVVRWYWKRFPFSVFSTCLFSTFCVWLWVNKNHAFWLVGDWEWDIYVHNVLRYTCNISWPHGRSILSHYCTYVTLVTHLTVLENFSHREYVLQNPTPSFIW